MTDHTSIQTGDTICDGQYTVQSVEQSNEVDSSLVQITITAAPAGPKPDWHDAPAIKITRSTGGSSFLLRNEFGGGYRAADGSIHTIAEVLRYVRQNTVTVQAVR